VSGQSVQATSDVGLSGFIDVDGQQEEPSMRDQQQSGVIRTNSTPFVPDQAAWDAWRPEEIARRLEGVQAPWYVAAGWAIDLFLGEERRAHEDLEIAAPHERIGEIAAALAGFEFFVVGDGLAWPQAEAGEQFEAHHQTWVREPETGRWRVDVFREPKVNGRWVYRRDARISLPYDEVIARTPGGVPYARPEIALLFKAGEPRPKDEGDFAAALPRLDSESRRRLAGALDALHPGHPWRAALGPD